MASRAADLGTIASVLPMERRDELAELLTDKHVETLGHFIKEEICPNTSRVNFSDAAYRSLEPLLHRANCFHGRI